MPGNIGLSERHKLARVREIFRPYHDRIATELDRRREAARPTALISVHSFTPVFKTVARLWHVGVLYNRDPRFTQILMEVLHCEDTIPVHGEQRDLHHVALEIRQDLITAEAGHRMWAALFARSLPQAYQRLTSLQVPK